MGTQRGIKYAYIDDSEIQERINSGELDPYDIIFAKQSHTQYIVKPDLTLFDITGKLYSFNSISEANEILNSQTNTYQGQLVSIYSDSLQVYQGYIVNKNETGTFYVTPLWESGGESDYNALQNIPIANLVGDGIILSTKDTGLYKVVGSYKISPYDEEMRIATNAMLFFVEKNTYVKEISPSYIRYYQISNTEIIESNYITEKYLSDNNYITETYLDSNEYTTTDDIEKMISDDYTATDEEVSDIFS